MKRMGRKANDEEMLLPNILKMAWISGTFELKKIPFSKRKEKSGSDFWKLDEEKWPFLCSAWKLLGRLRRLTVLFFFFFRSLLILFLHRPFSSKWAPVAAHFVTLAAFLSPFALCDSFNFRSWFAAWNPFKIKKKHQPTPNIPPFHVSGSLSEVKISLPFSPCPEPLSFRTKNSGPGRPKKGIKKIKTCTPTTKADGWMANAEKSRRNPTGFFFSTFHLFMFVIT